MLGMANGRITKAKEETLNVTVRKQKKLCGWVQVEIAY